MKSNPYNRASHSALKVFERSPIHYKYHRDNPPATTPALIFGNMLHCFILQPEEFSKRYFLLDDSERPLPQKNYQTKVNQEWKKEQLELNADKIVVFKEDMEKIEEIKEAIENDPIAWPLIQSSGNSFEQTITWKENDIPCKGIIDIKNDLFLADLKSCIDADPETFVRDIIKYKYYRQGAMYLAGEKFGHFDYNEKKPFFFIAIEKTKPYGVSVIKLSEEFINEGLVSYKSLLKSLKVCIDKDFWPGYYFKSKFNEDGIFTAIKPGWM